MKYKKTIRVLFCIIFLALAFYICMGNINVKASLPAVPDIKQNDVKIDPTISGSGFGEALRSIIAYLQIASTAISIIVLTILGIKYVTASVEAKAEVKKEITPIAIGMLLVFGAVNIVGIAADVVGQIFG